MTESIVFTAALVISLFVLFVLTKNDFVLLRKGISQNHLFDIFLGSLIFAYIFSRIFYIIDASQYDYIHILKFFYPTKFEGLSLLGLYLGGLFAAMLFYRGRSAHMRIFDIFLLSTYPILPIFLLFHGYEKNVLIGIAASCISLILFSISLWFHNKYTLKDGSVGLLLMSSICISQFLYSMQVSHVSLILSLSLSQIVSLILGVFSVVLLVLNQMYAKK